MQKKQRIFKEKDILWLIICLLGIFLFIFPYMSVGTTNNDEVQARYWSMLGFKEFYSHFFEELLLKGRAISCWIVPITHMLGYIGEETYCFKILQILVILLNIGAFGKLIKMLFSKGLSKLTILMLFLFLPITFEPTLPNAYVAIYGLPLFFIFLSLILYIKYIRIYKKRYLVFSMLLFVIACCSYEAFITYAPIYWIICIYEKKIYSWKKCKQNLVELSVPFITGILFALIYIITVIIFPSLYAGNQIGFTVNGALTIIKNLFKSSLPASFLFSAKYRYLFDLYKDRIEPEDILRVIVVLLIAFLIGFYIARKDVKISSDKKNIIKNLIY